MTHEHKSAIKTNPKNTGPVRSRSDYKNSLSVGREGWGSRVAALSAKGGALKKNWYGLNLF